MERTEPFQKSSPAVSETLPRALGWFSLGLGAAELLAPRRMAEWLGAPENDPLIRALGLRELLSGGGILTDNKPGGWVWSRVAGDVMDLLLLGAAARSENSRPGRLALAAAAVGGVTALDIWCGRGLGVDGAAGIVQGPVSATSAITVQKQAAILYDFWRDVSNLPRFMKNIESVTPLSETRSHWKASLPGGIDLEWDSEITEDRPNQFIAWRTIAGDIPQAGWVSFRDRGERGTAVEGHMELQIPGGRLAAAAAALIGQSPAQLLGANLRRFRQLMETGEIATVEGQPAGRPSGTVWYDRAFD